MELTPTFAWLILVASGACETIWAAALGDSSQGWPQRITRILIGAALSMGGLAAALTVIPVSIGYAVWVGVGAVATFGWSVFKGYEKATLAKTGSALLILVGVAGLKVVG